jgi:hypothetical protein
MRNAQCGLTPSTLLVRIQHSEFAFISVSHHASVKEICDRMNLAPALLSLLVIVSCARASAVNVGEAPPALLAALADTARLSRIHFAGEVVKPVAPREGNEPPYVAGLPDGEAQAQVVVGPDGRVDTGTAYLLPGSAQGLGAPLLRALGGWRFYPAELSDSAKVRQLVAVRLVKRGNGIVIDVNPAPRR